MIVLPRLLELLKAIHHDAYTTDELVTNTGISESAIRGYLLLLEEHGFVSKVRAVGRKVKGRVPRVYVLAPEWRGSRER